MHWWSLRRTSPHLRPLLRHLAAFAPHLLPLLRHLRRLRRLHLDLDLSRSRQRHSSTSSRSWSQSNGGSGTCWTECELTGRQCTNVASGTRRRLKILLWEWGCLFGRARPVNLIRTVLRVRKQSAPFPSRWRNGFVAANMPPGSCVSVNRAAFERPSLADEI